MGPLVPMPSLITCTSTSSPRRRISWIGGLKRGRPPKRWLRGRCARRLRRLRRTRRPRPIRSLRCGGRRGGRRAHRLAGIEAALAEVLRLDVADVQETVAAHAEIDEGRLDARLQVDHHALVDVSYVIVLPGPLHVQFFEHSVLNDRDPAFLRLRDVDQHFLFHVVAFSFGNTDEYAFAAGKRGGLARR